jgi:hypothetical protein
MARINSKTALRNYIKTQLGHPVIQIEVTNTQIDQIIDDSVNRFTEYAYGDLEAAVLVQISGMGTYDMPDTMTNMIKFSKGGGAASIGNFASNFGYGFVPDIWSEQKFSGTLTGGIVDSIISVSTTKALLDKFFGDDIHCNFNHLSKKLQVLENFSGPALIHYHYEYLANENSDFVYDHEWIKGYSKAKVKELWGTITGKYDQTLVGGARINYADFKSEAREEIDRLNEELLNKWSDPAPISIA